MSSIGSKLTSNLCRGSCGRKSRNAERTAQQENEDEIIARVIEGETPEDRDVQIGLDDMDREQMQNYEDGQYGTMERLWWLIRTVHTLREYTPHVTDTRAHNYRVWSRCYHRMCSG